MTAEDAIGIVAVACLCFVAAVVVGFLLELLS